MGIEATRPVAESCGDYFRGLQGVPLIRLRLLGPREGVLGPIAQHLGASSGVALGTLLHLHQVACGPKEAWTGK